VPHGGSLLRFVEQVRGNLYPVGLSKKLHGIDNNRKGQTRGGEDHAEEFIVHSEAEFAQHVEPNLAVEVGAHEVAGKHPEREGETGGHLINSNAFKYYPIVDNLRLFNNNNYE
jgi:hypothetical protein